MIIIDSSVWIETFTKPKSSVAVEVEFMLSEGHEIAILPFIITEVLMGFRKQSDFNLANQVLSQLRLVHPADEIYKDAADLFRSLRKNGITPRGVIDCIIAQTCIEAGAYIFSLNRDFPNIAKHTALKLFERKVLN